ncbi:Uncharacterized protein Fot_22779 [Forsythia ovata]|uniref:Uncharacterized protein n=1 Tax=Forsythia ovata TaxID=205694 RepID=A0ABD1V0N1_9LAMI
MLDISGGYNLVVESFRCSSDIARLSSYQRLVHVLAVDVPRARVVDAFDIARLERDGILLAESHCYIIRSGPHQVKDYSKRGKLSALVVEGENDVKSGYESPSIA